MNAKTILSLTVLGAVTAASAAVTSANTLCRIEVASNTKNTIVAVPLKQVAGENDSIKLTDLVLTDNLAEGDHLLHKVSTGWEAWVINSSGKWEAAVVSDAGITTIAGSDTAFDCGGAFWLVRANPKGSFYLYGQVVDQTVSTPSITRTSDAPTYIMMGNTKLAETAINSLSIAGVKEAGDKIMVPASTGLGVKEYTWSGSAWQKPTYTMEGGVLSSKMQDTADTIPAGQGFWYVAKENGTNN